MQQLYSAESKVDLTFDLPDLSSALSQIQSQYDSIAAKNLQVWCLKIPLALLDTCDYKQHVPNSI